MKKLITTFKQISILILAVTFMSCEDDDTVLPQVVAGFTHTINADTGVVTFINISENATKYSWSFGDGTSATLINPVKAYSPGEYKVTLKASNSAGASDTFEDTIIISDVGAPVITLNGSATINITLGDTFTDPGATATDDLDGDITANIVVGGDDVDVNTAGTYIITYNVSDAAGNAATQRTRTVIVTADTVAPVITLTGSSTINIAVGGAFTDPGATATDDVDGDITANIVVAGDAVDVNTAATYTITYNVSDAAGNAAVQVTRTVIVGGVDAIAPVITLIGNATVNVTVGGIFVDPGAAASDNVDGNITSSIVVGGDTVDVNTVGTYIITYNVSDAAGNAAAQVTRTVIVAVAGPSNGNMAVNGDFETGDTSGWTLFLQPGSSFTASTNNPKTGSFSGNLVADFSVNESGPVDAVVKQANLLPAEPNTEYIISFDLLGSASDGGVFFVEFFSELSGGGTSKAEIITGGPHPLTETWSSYSYTLTTGSDVSGGITMQMKSSCGPVAGCLVDAYFDNVSIKIK